MNQPIYWLLVTLGLILGVASGSFAQSGASLVDFTQLTADEREQLRSQLRNRGGRAVRLPIDRYSGAPLRSGLSALERQALRELLRDIDSRQDLAPDVSRRGDVKIDALNDSSPILEPIASNEPFSDNLDKPVDAWPAFNSNPDHPRGVGH